MRLPSCSSTVSPSYTPRVHVPFLQRRHRGGRRLRPRCLDRLAHARAARRAWALQGRATPRERECEVHGPCAYLCAASNTRAFGMGTSAEECRACGRRPAIAGDGHRRPPPRLPRLPGILPLASRSHRKFVLGLTASAWPLQSQAQQASAAVQQRRNGAPDGLSKLGRKPNTYQW